MESFKRKTVIFGCLVLGSLLTRGLFLRIPFLDIDESAHIIGSWQLLAGKTLYVNFVDNKPPLLYAYYALCQILAGKGMFAVHLLTVLFMVPLTAFAASAFYEHSMKGIVSGLLFLIFSAAFLAHDMLAANAEILMLPAGAWAVVLLRKEKLWTSPYRSAAAGFLLGIGSLIKYQIALWVPALAAAAFLEALLSGRISRFAGFFLLLIGFFLLPAAGAYCYYAGKGAQNEFIYWTLLNNFHYAANPISLREAAGRAAASLLPFLLATAPLWWMGWRSLHLHESPYRLALIFALLAFTIPAAFLGFRFFGHYFVQFYFPLAIAAGPAVTAMFSETPQLRLISGRNTSRIIFTLSAGLVFLGFTIANAILYFGNAGVYRETDPVFSNTGKRIRSDICYSSNQTMFVWGYSPAFYYYAGLLPASRFAVLAQSRLTGYISGNFESARSENSQLAAPDERQWTLLMYDLENSMPAYIIDTAPAGIYRWNHYPISDYPPLDKFVRHHYKKIDVVDNVVIYRKSGCKQEAL